MRKALILLLLMAFCSVATAAAIDLHEKRQNEEGLIYWYGSPERSEIALTFDDGPNNVYTLQTLDILKAHGIRATFFLIGEYVNEDPRTAKKIVEEGHTIGNHTYSHPDLRFMFKDAIQKEIKRGGDAIFEVTGVRTRLFRPPYGASEDKIINIAKDMGYVTIAYSVTASDGGKKIESEKIIKNILEKTKNGSIILAHDGNSHVKNSDRARTVEALGVIIGALKEKGYRFVTVPELLDFEGGKI